MKTKTALILLVLALIMALAVATPAFASTKYGPWTSNGHLRAVVNYTYIGYNEGTHSYQYKITSYGVQTKDGLYNAYGYVYNKSGTRVRSTQLYLLNPFGGTQYFSDRGFYVYTGYKISCTGGGNGTSSVWF